MFQAEETAVVKVERGGEAGEAASGMTVKLRGAVLLRTRPGAGGETSSLPETGGAQAKALAG